MTIFRRIRKFTSQLAKSENPDNNYTFPYNGDVLNKRQQIWDNLQKGMLFEDKQVFMPWQLPFSELERFKEKRHDSGDRTQWYLGKRKILDGYEGHFEVMKWTWLPWTNPVAKISENIGYDTEGMKKFNYLKDYLTDLFGDPTKIELEKFGSFILGVIQWQNRLAKLTLTGIEHFNCRYSFSIGLVEDINELP